MQLSSTQIKTVVAVVFFKIILLTFLPLTGDEAYFIKWAMHPSLGYYDHPPMIGWVIYLLSFISENFIFYRYFTLLTTMLVALVIYKIARLYEVDRDKSLMLYMLFLVSPVDVLLSLITNDITLVLFGSLGTLFLLYALEKQEHWLKYSLLAGTFLAFSFLSKYFAVFLMFSLVLFSFVVYKKSAIKVVLVVSVLVLLGVAENLWFNYNSCWNNILFNFFARSDDHGFNINRVMGFFALFTYILTPWGVYFIIRAKNKTQAIKLNRLLLFILGLVFIVFFIVSMKNRIGLHWFLLFIPYMYLLFVYLDAKQLRKMFLFNAIFSFIHIAILMVVIFTPKNLFEDFRRYSDVVLMDNPQAVCRGIEEYDANRFFTSGYTSASFLSYHCKKDISMLFYDRKYARYDDKLVDVRELQDENIVFMNKRKMDESYMRGVCTDVSIEKKMLGGAPFYFAQCKGFNYDVYKKEFLDFANENYYNIPDWLPVGECYFKDRYYSE